MKKYLLLLVGALCFCLNIVAQTYPKKANVIRLLTYNSHYCKGGTDPVSYTHLSLGQAIQGAIPNLNISFGSGKPGEVTNMNIRGFASINGESKPLILIDGVEGSIDNLNPRDVESISVLKDASSSAIYGARAPFGVVLVTTKKGKSGKMQISYNGRYSFSTSTTKTCLLYTSLKV